MRYMFRKLLFQLTATTILFLSEAIANKIAKKI